MTLSEILKKYSVAYIPKKKTKHNKDFYNRGHKKDKYAEITREFNFESSDARMLVLANVEKYGEQYSLIHTNRKPQE